MAARHTARGAARLLAFLVAGLLLLAGGLARAADLVPYLQTPTATSIWVSWKTSTATAPVVQFGTAANALNQQASGSSQKLADNYFFHGVQLSGLQPNTFYFYRIKSGSQVSDVQRFRTQPTGASRGKFRVLVTGDHQIRDQDRHRVLLSAAKAKIEAMYGQPLEAVVNLMINDGDQVDVGTLDHYENLHFAQSAPVSRNIPIMTTVGNHETYYDPGMVNWKAHFFIDGINYKGHAAGPDERYYANLVGRVLFIHLDSEATSNTQRDWVRGVVNTAAVDADVDWIVSVIHRPYQAEQYVGDISSWLRDQVMPILSSTPKHVINIAGHHHLYARGQTRDTPTYHMISGGTAWDQYWGQSTEKDFDDVQKTIANWTWQLIEFDLDTNEMTVRSYAEAHPKLGFVYQSRLIDEFHRKLDRGAPDQPALVGGLAAGLVTLPHSFSSGAFGSAFGEALNTTRFQVARDASFNDVVLDRIRDVENIYGDTGAPDYEPVDIHKGVDILSLEIPQYGLPNGTYQLRVRHRDTNLQWSPWSASGSFTVAGSTSGSPQITLAKKVYAATGDPVVVSYANGTGNPKDWVGIYRKGQTPGSVGSTKFQYVTGLNGTLSFTGLAAGTEYYVAFFSNDGYTEMAPRVPFFVGSTPVMAISKTVFAVGEAVTFNWTQAPAGAKDWIGIYRVGQTPGQVGSTQFKYTTTASGSASFTGLPKGYYYASFFVNDGYFEIIERIGFSVGDRIGTVAMDKTALAVGEDVGLTFSNGPGIPKDYIGIFKQGATPGVGADGKLVVYHYVDGKSSGSLQITDDLPEGSYFLALYTNDSYTEVSNRVDFTVGNASLPPPAATLAASKGVYLTTEAVGFSWANTPGGALDWIGIYKAGQSPGAVPATQWRYLPAAAGTTSFSGLAPGAYYATVLLNDGYTEAVPRVSFRVVLQGDINGDGRVDMADYAVIRAAMGACFGDPRYVLAANFDSDSCITANDYKLWYAIFKRQ
jgi:hypothetical protein